MLRLTLRRAVFALMPLVFAANAVPAAATPTTLQFDTVYYFNGTTPGTVADQLAHPGSGCCYPEAIEVQVFNDITTSFFSTFTAGVSATELGLPTDVAAAVPGYTCLQLATSFSSTAGPSCIEFHVTPTNSGQSTVLPDAQLFPTLVKVTIAWQFDTNPTTTSPVIVKWEDGPSLDASLLRDSTYFPTGDRFGNINFSDAAIDGTTDNFTNFAVAYHSVPEPSTVMLLGFGLFGIAWFRFRRPELS